MLVMQSIQRISLIGFLLALIFAPVVLAGYGDLSFAQSLISAHDQSIYYESAAQRLPWMNGLYEAAGSAALRADEYERAITLLQGVRQKSALTANGQFDLGKAYFLRGDQEKAFAAWQGLLNGTPATASVSPYFAAAYHAQARFDDEQQVLRQWLALDPHNADAQYMLGLLLFADASPEAVPLFESVASTSPSLKPAADGLRTALKTALEAPSTAQKLTQCGQTLAAIGEWPLALRTFSRATQDDPNHALAWAWLGEARHQTGSGDALEALQRAASLDPNSAQIHAMYGIYWQRQRDWQKARSAFENAARLEPRNPAWQTSLGAIYVHLGDLITALAYYQDAIRLAPNDSQAWRALAVFSIENSVDVEGLARDAALRAYALEPENARNLDVLGRALLVTEQYDAAETFFKKALAAIEKTEPNAGEETAAIAYHLGLLYLRTNKPALAKEYLQSAQALDPDGPIGTQAASVLARYFP